MLIRLIRACRALSILARACGAALVDAAFPPRATERLVRGLPPDALSSRIAVMKVPLSRSHGHTYIGMPMSTPEAVALLPYRLQEVEACIIEAKFHDSHRAARLAGHALAYFLNEYRASNEQHDHAPFVLVPIPLSRKRLRERGYNQAERIARAAVRVLPTLTEVISFPATQEIAHHLQMLDATLLARARDTLPQTRLSGRDRRRNLEGAFVATRPCDPARTYIVLDDVITTGSTLAAAAQALHAAGATRIIPLAIAHADLASPQRGPRAFGAS